MPDGSVIYFTIEDEITLVASNSPGDRVLHLQRIKFDSGQIELRLGYYIIGKRPGRLCGKWAWGQFAPFLPAEDFRAIVDEAIERGWI